MTVVQAYDLHDPAFPAPIKGAPQGWAQTLAKLTYALARMDRGRSAEHGCFSIDRVFAAAPARVFRAFTEAAAKSRWFGSDNPNTVLEQHMDVRPGGTERLTVRWGSGLVTSFDATYFDVVPDQRLVYTYEMPMDGEKISVSLATLEFAPHDGGTRLKVMEQGVFLDGYDDRVSREAGTAHLLERRRQSVEG
jgi:uncharacterized protein YndB with AHSA1/START domain